MASAAKVPPSGPINFVHNDYSVASGVRRARALLGPFATSAGALDKALAGRVAVINVWAPLEDVDLRGNEDLLVRWETTTLRDYFDRFDGPKLGTSASGALVWPLGRFTSTPDRRIEDERP